MLKGLKLLPHCYMLAATSQVGVYIHICDISTVDSLKKDADFVRAINIDATTKKHHILMDE